LTAHRKERSPGPPRSQIDWVSAAMALVTSVAIVWAFWLRFAPGNAPRVEPPAVGSSPPALRLLDRETSRPISPGLIGPRGRVVWLTFWSAATASGRADLPGLESVWARLKARPRFVMAAAAVESDRPEAVRSALAGVKATLPVYLAPPETRRAFGAEAVANLPLHLLIDESGKVGAIAHGGGDATLSRLADQAERWLDELEPLGRTRFARREPSGFSR